MNTRWKAATKFLAQNFLAEILWQQMFIYLSGRLSIKK